MQTRQASKNKGCSTLLGSVFSILFNGLLIALLSWVVLIFWCCVRIVFFNEGDSQQAIHFYAEILIKHNELLANNISTRFDWLQHQCITILSQLIEFHKAEKVISILADNLELIFLKLTIFILWLPFFTLIWLLAVIDGLVQRDIRKFQGARESSFLFHRIKPLIGVSVTSLYFCYMACPLAIRPECFLIPLALISGLFVMLAIKGFKKYL